MDVRFGYSEIISTTDEPNSEPNIDDESSYGDTDNEADRDDYYTHDDIQYDNAGDGDGDESETDHAEDDDNPEVDSSL